MEAKEIMNFDNSDFLFILEIAENRKGEKRNASILIGAYAPKQGERGIGAINIKMKKSYILNLFEDMGD